MTDRTDDFRLIAAALPPQPRRGSPHPPKVRAGVIFFFASLDVVPYAVSNQVVVHTEMGGVSVLCLESGARVRR